MSEETSPPSMLSETAYTPEQGQTSPEQTIARLGEQSVDAVFSEQLASEVHRRPNYRAPYMEVPRDSITKDWRAFLRQVVPHGYRRGRYTNFGPRESGDIMLRFVDLPEDPEARSVRVEEIARSGTDRTNSAVRSQFQSIYERLSREAGIDQMLIFDALGTVGFAHMASSGNSLASGTGVFSGANGILIYDAKTEKGIIPVPSRHASPAEMTFRDPSRKNEALLRIVYLT